LSGDIPKWRNLCYIRRNRSSEDTYIRKQYKYTYEVTKNLLKSKKYRYQAIKQKEQSKLKVQKIRL